MVLYVERNNNHYTSELRKAIYDLFEDPSLIKLSGANVFKDTAEDVIRHFLYGYQHSGKSLYILFHHLGIDFQSESNIASIEYYFDALIELLSHRFQVIAGIVRKKDYCHASYIINSVSIDGISIFSDCNSTYIYILELLTMIAGVPVETSVCQDDNVLFKNRNNNSENYRNYIGR